jgi:hypothetical protein
MADGSGQRGFGLLLLKAGAIVGALGFLAAIMVNACRHSPAYMPATKAGPLMEPGTAQVPPPQAPPPAARSQPPAASAPKPARSKRDWKLEHATKAGPVFDPDDDQPAPPQQQPERRQGESPQLPQR